MCKGKASHQSGRLDFDPGGRLDFEQWRLISRSEEKGRCNVQTVCPRERPNLFAFFARQLQITEFIILFSPE
jgi:hypothetical protein